MKTTKTHGILLGLGVLGVSTLMGAFQPVQAAPTFNEVQWRRDNGYRRPVRRPGYGRPGGVIRPNQVNQVIRGRVTKDLRGSSFNMRNGNGPVITVNMLGVEPRRISRDDQVQVSGYFRNGVFIGQSLNILRNR